MIVIIIILITVIVVTFVIGSSGFNTDYKSSERLKTLVMLCYYYVYKYISIYNCKYNHTSLLTVTVPRIIITMYFSIYDCNYNHRSTYCKCC